MAGPIPESKVNQLADRIDFLSQVIFDGGTLNEIAWQAAYRESIQLDETPQARYALISRVALLSLKVDITGIQTALDLYLKRFGEDWMWHSSRASVAHHLSRPDFIAEMIENVPADADIRDLVNSLNFSAQCGFFTSANTLLERLKAMKASILNSERAVYLSELSSSADYLQEAGISEVDVAERIAVAWRVTRAHVKTARTFDLSTNEEGISYNLGVYASVERCIEIQRQIDAALFKQFDDPMSDHLSIGVFPFTMGAA